jgi:hypothetical protein
MNRVEHYRRLEKPESCIWCGEPTWALLVGASSHAHHMTCGPHPDQHFPPREEPNRHDRRRAGLPRPSNPRCPWCGALHGYWCETQ